MKKHSIFAAVLLAMGMFVFSCNKVIESDIQTPEEKIDEAQPVEMTFTASVAAKDATKSVGSDGVTAWVAGEEINVYYQKSDDSYASATATVGTPRGDGSAPISATLTSAKDGSTVKFVYPAGLADASGDLDASKLAAQHGTIADISANYDAATGTGTLVTDGATCSTDALVTMTNQVLIGKFTPKHGSPAAEIDGITTITITDGTNTYTVTPSAGTFGTTGIYVAMLPVDNKEMVITASTASKNYEYKKSGITLAVGKLYNNLAVTMSRIISFSTSTDGYNADALRYTLNDAIDGDIIEMASGTYATESTNYIEFFGKHITVRAASGADVIIKTKRPVRVAGGSKAEFIDIKFDATLVTGGYEHLMYAGDDDANNRLILENCEVYNFSRNGSAIYCSSSSKFATVTFNNCYFHDIKKSCFFSEGAVGSFTLTNSTIANITTDSESYWAGIFDLRGSDVVVSVDHCTFYNCLPMNTDYGAVTVKASTQTSNSVSNCIFVMPTSTAQRGVYFGDSAKGQINYNINLNYTGSTNGIRNGGATKSNCSDADPLFTNAASSDFTLGATSPARTASATSGPIGDPRWY